MKINLSVYRKFWKETIEVGYPPRYGYDWFTAAIDKLKAAPVGKEPDWLDMSQEDTK